MSISKARARKIAKRILRENRKGRSWRVIAREDYPTVKPGTLNRFAKEKGAYIPVDEDILVALGLKHVRQPKPHPEPLSLEWWKELRKRAVKSMAEATKRSVLIQHIDGGDK